MNWLQRHLGDPENVSRIQRAFYWTLAAVVLAEIVVLVVWRGEHAHFWFERIPAFGSLYGLASCVVIILASKFLGKAWLMRGEDYYDR